MQLPSAVITHFFWGILILLAGLIVHRKAKETGLDMLEDFRNFFLIWGGLFFGGMALGWTLGIYLDSQVILSLAYTVPVVFAFTAIGYLWKLQASIQFPSRKNYFYAFVALGVGLAAFGVYEMPTVVAQNNMLLLGPESLFSLGTQIGTLIALVSVSSVGAYTAYLSSGQTRLKMGLISQGSLFIVIGGIGYNMGTSIGNIVGAVGNALWILSFLAAISLDNITGVLGVINDKL